jgi:hypothetical protein
VPYLIFITLQQENKDKSLFAVSHPNHVEMPVSGVEMAF